MMRVAYNPTPLLLALSAGHAFAFAPNAFAPPSSTTGLYATTKLAALPTIEQVSAGDFYAQLGLSSQIMPYLHPEGDDEISEEDSAALSDVLSSQFTHIEGIRGFMACYLSYLITSPVAESLMAKEVPDVLAKAVQGADAGIMVPLACNNVVLPTAMTSIQKDEELRASSSKTAANGLKILRLLKGNDTLRDHCRAISIVCSGSEGGPEHPVITHWKMIIVNSKIYGDEQKKDIALAVSEFCN